MAENRSDKTPPRVGKVAIHGLGAIGTPLALSLAPHVSALILCDRDRVEPKNIHTQSVYEPAHVGRFKVDALRECLRGRFPQLEVLPITADIEDVPLGWSDVPDVLLGAFDNLRARQVLNERACRLGRPWIDGGVGEPMLGCVHVFLPGQACEECHWTPAHYRRLALETPCAPGGDSRIAPTRSPAAISCAVASVMAAECLKLLAGRRESTGIQIAFDLDQRQLNVSRLRRASDCRFDHETVTQKCPLAVGLASATIGDVLAAIRSEPEATAIEARRGIFNTELFGHDSMVGRERLKSLAKRSLASLGLTPMDRLRIVPGDGSPSWFLTLTQ